MGTAVKVVFGVILGGIMGYGYYRLVGCSTGTCPITSDPKISTLYGIVMGVLLALG